ncbi:fructosamine-3-kinase [Paenibacillus sp. V4I3]|uniref:phosphotransferase n=1 Tax=Paenibacillus sp. V4I3 TaxID=3042305 RepID=UPI002783AF2B|nr:phosphotransferase [Paenibacillus sp. V4I3]MDQ0877848.1 fructosamine-3-kinase [Paenibacillus sp. V4I3]
MNLQTLFLEQILSQSSLGGHASDVWLVNTISGEYVVRSSGVDESVDAPFLWVCRNLFGIELSRTYDIEGINLFLQQTTTKICVPNVLSKGLIDGRQFVIVEKMNGSPLDFLNKPAEMMKEFGRTIGEIHAREFYECGAPNGTFRYTLRDFPQKLTNTIRNLSSRYYLSNDAVAKMTEYYCSLASKLPVPKSASYIMLDMDPRQFLAEEERVRAIVDTEAYVIGPREFELSALECSLDQFGADNFMTGYRSALPFPDLTPVRDVYRFMFYLMEIKGPSVDYDNWFSFPHYFSKLSKRVE